MQTGMKPPRKKLVRVNPYLLVILAVLLVAIAAAAIFIIPDALKREPFPVREVAVPGAQLPDRQTPQAMRYDLSGEEQAQAYFQRLLDSRFINLSAPASQAPQQTEDGWTVTQTTADGTALTATFDSQGIITLLDFPVDRGGETHASNPQYRLGDGDDSLFSFIRTFAYEYLPDVTIDSGAIENDQYTDEGRFITVLVHTQYAQNAFRFVVQVDPVQRITGFEVLVDPSLAFIRSSRMAGAQTDAATPTEDADPSGAIDQNTAIQRARDALCEVYGLPESDVAAFVLVDIAYYTADSQSGYSMIDSPAYWVIHFRKPETDEKFYSDYAVFLDEATGDVLHLLDPSNVSNG